MDQTRTLLRNIQAVRSMFPDASVSDRQAAAAVNEALADDALCSIPDILERKWQMAKRCRALIEAMLKGEVYG